MDPQSAADFSQSQTPRHYLDGFHPSRLLRTQSDQFEPGLNVSTASDQPVVRRRLSLPMPPHQSNKSTSKSSRKPSFKISLPSFRLSPSPGSATGFDTPLFKTGPSADSDVRSLRTFIPAPLTPPDEPSLIELCVEPLDLSDSCTRISSTSHPSEAASQSAMMPQAMESSDDPEESSRLPDTIPMSPIDELVSNAVSSVKSSLTSPTSIKIVYQALPFPVSEDFEFSTSSVYDTLIKSLQGDVSLPAKYLHVVQSLPERCPTGSIPTSPPVTPGSMTRQLGEQGYFGVRPVISNAVIMVDRYQPMRDLTASMVLSPGLALPPCEAALSVYERVIPPSTGDEALDFFEATGRSALIDRMQELAPSGTLMVVYPTQAGGREFQSRYLGPILEPVLRTLLDRYGLSREVGEALGNMAAVRYLKPFNEMKSSLRTMLRRLNEEESGGASTPFTTLHASSSKIQVSRRIWEKWWVHQEKPRIDQFMSEYFQRGASLPARGNVTAASLARELIEGVERRGYEPGEQTGEGGGIEVGLFIIKRAA